MYALIEEAVKEKYGSKIEFCKAVGVSAGNSTRYLKSLGERIDKLNEALEPLALFLKLVR